MLRRPQQHDCSTTALQMPLFLCLDFPPPLHCGVSRWTGFSSALTFDPRLGPIAGIEPASLSWAPSSLGSIHKFIHLINSLFFLSYLLQTPLSYSLFQLSISVCPPSSTPVPREPTAAYSLPPQCCSQYLGIYLTPTCEAWWKCLGNGKENKHALSPGPLVLLCYKYLRVARQFQHQWHGNLSPSSGPLLGHSSSVWEGFSQQASLKGWVDV